MKKTIRMFLSLQMGVAAICWGQDATTASAKGIGEAVNAKPIVSPVTVRVAGDNSITPTCGPSPKTLASSEKPWVGGVLIRDDQGSTAGAKLHLRSSSAVSVADVLPFSQVPPVSVVVGGSGSARGTIAPTHHGNPPPVVVFAEEMPRLGQVHVDGDRGGAVSKLNPSPRIPVIVGDRSFFAQTAVVVNDSSAGHGVIAPSGNCVAVAPGAKLGGIFIK